MKKIMVGDVSLKFIGSESGVNFSFKEKLEIAKRLSSLNTDIIELSPVANDKADEVLVKTISAVVKNSVIACAAGNTEEEAELAYSVISGSAKKRLLVSVPVSPVQMEYSSGKKPAAVIEHLKNMTIKARSLCQDVEVSLEDATRAEPEFLYVAVKAAIEAGAKTVSITDLAGTMTPFEFSDFITELYKNVPELKTVNLGVQTSDALSMGTACAIAALIAGADEIKVAAVGVGNLPQVESVSRAIEYVGAKKGFSCDINKTAIGKILTGINNIAQGNASAETEKKNNDYPKEKLTEENVSYAIKKLGYDLSAEDEGKVIEEFKRVSAKKIVREKELEVIIATCALQVPATYSLVNFCVTSSNVLSATASVTLKKDGEELKGISFGNGPVDAAFLAIESVIGRHFELDSFDLGAVTEGKEALGQAVVKLRHNGSIYSGRGVSTDIIGASIRAYISALNKVAYEEKNK